MDLLKSIQEQLRQHDVEVQEVRALAEAVEALDAKNIFRLDEIFGGKKKAAEAEKQERLKRVMSRGKIGSVEAKKGDWEGGAMGSGRLAELVKLYGIPKFDNGTPPHKPEGMSPEDYKIWIAGHDKQRKESLLGDAVGPAVGDAIRANGELYQVTGTSGLASIVVNAEGKKVKVSWNKLGPGKDVDGKKVYTLTGK